MVLIVITPEQIRPDEAQLISEMLQMGVNRVHLRHPSCSLEEFRNIIKAIPLEYRSQLSLHDNFRLTVEFPELGVNLNRRNPEVPAGSHGLISRSCHSVVDTLMPSDYCLLSPIFPSISKDGYYAEFSKHELNSLPPNRVIALGGIDSERIDLIKRYPFSGVAVLGSVWDKDTDPADVIKNVAKILDKL